MLDRLVHHSHLLDFTNRDSKRLHDALLKQSTTKSQKKSEKKG
ncbi:MAG: hypothetical protein FWF78_07855 [Defluviitaleaceae bacterium]|nr:hypothetical protein [Defluviitaleaceae bacterium]